MTQFNEDEFKRWKQQQEADRCAFCHQQMLAEFKAKYNLMVTCPKCGTEFNELNIPLVEQITDKVERAYIDYLKKTKPEEITEAVKNLRHKIITEIREKIEKHMFIYEGMKIFRMVSNSQWQKFWKEFN